MEGIKIIDDWYVVVELNPTNYTVKKGTGKKDSKGKSLDKPKGYFQSLRNAVKFIRDQIVAESLKDGSMSLEDALRKVSEVDERFENLMERIKA